MNEREELTKDLEELSKKWVDLKEKFSDQIIKYKNSNQAQKYLIKSGQEIINYYKKIFIPKYSKTEDFKIKEVGNKLEAISFMASLAIKNKNNFSLQVLIIPWGSKEGDPNNLDVLTNYLKKPSD